MHLLAKSILKKSKKLALPAFHYDYNVENIYSVFRESEILNFEDVLLEKSRVNKDQELFIPDAICVINKKELFVEFAKTHFVDLEKTTKIRKGESACIEIDIRDQPLDEDHLKEFLTKQTPEKYWIYNPRLEAEYNRKVEIKHAEFEREKRDRMNKYKLDSKIGWIKVKNDEVVFCPKRKVLLDDLKANNHYEGAVLKKVLNGARWNGTFYGKYPRAKYIFIENEKVTIYPEMAKYRLLSKKEVGVCNKLFAQLNELKTKINKSELGRCHTCPFHVDRMLIEENEYQYCKHSYVNDRH